MADHREDPARVLRFWFSETLPRQWFGKDAAFDALVRDRFLGLTRQALAGELNAWSTAATGGLALVLLLDQFPRQIWRDTTMAFAGDPQAQALSLRAVERGWLEAEVEQVTWPPKTEPDPMRASLSARLGQEKPHETQTSQPRADHPQAAHC
jgi:uncharacterized protein (DUF924 family)